MKNHKKLILLLTAVVLVLSVSVGITLAYLTDATESVTNTFTPTSAGVEVEDKVEKGTKKDVKITNTGDIPVYVRVAVVANWCVDGEIVAQWDDYATIASLAGTSWTRDGIYFYYNGVLQPDDDITLFASYTPEKGEGIPDKAELQMDIIAQVIQAEGMGATSAQDAFAKAAK